MPRRTQAAAQRRTRASPTTSPVDAGLATMAGHCICGNLRMASRLVTAYYDAALRPAGVEANQMIMLWVAHSSDRMPAHEVARVAGMDESTASRNLAVLHDRGLIAFATAQEDRRRRLVSLTPRGRTVLARAYPRWERAQHEMTALAADIADLPALGRVLRKVSRRIQDA